MPFLSHYPQIKVIQDIARQKKISVYLVGGFLRDFLLGIKKYDFDFAVSSGALALARSFSRKLRGAYVLLDEKRGCARVAKRIGGNLYTFDFAEFRAKTLKGDLASRDFTINALFLNVSDFKKLTEIPGILKDNRNGIRDIRKKCIRRISAKAFREDPLRMMRAFSLQATLGFKIELATLNQIRKEKDLIKNVTYERIRDELFKILATERTAQAFKEMDRVGLLEKIIPQINVMFCCRQGAYHHLDVWPHSLETVVQLEKIFKRLKANDKAKGYLQSFLGGNRSRQSLMKLAALLHDIGKPDTRRPESDGRISFHGHEHVGRTIVGHVGKMLKLSTRERHALEDMVRWHLRPGYLSNFKKPSERAVYRYFRDAHEESVSILLLSLADQRATRGPATTQKDQEHHQAICLGLMQRHFDQDDKKPFVPLINGDDLIKTLKLSPAPLFARILSEVRERQALGELKDKGQALALARQISDRERAGR